MWTIDLLRTRRQDERQRPCSPNTALPRQTKHRKTQILYDAEDGKQLSPACSGYAKSEPSILWSPPRESSLPSCPSLVVDWEHAERQTLGQL